MTYNKCETCGACDGRAGILFGKKGLPNECENCKDTRESGNFVLHSHLMRTEEEVKRMTDTLLCAK